MRFTRGGSLVLGLVEISLVSLTLRSDVDPSPRRQRLGPDSVRSSPMRTGRSSGRGEFRPPALADPGVSLSAHRALVIRPWAALLASVQRGAGRVRGRWPASVLPVAGGRAAVCISSWPTVRGSRRCV